MVYILGAIFCGNLLGQFFGTMFGGDFLRVMFLGQYFWGDFLGSDCFEVIFCTLFKAILPQQSLSTFNLIFSYILAAYYKGSLNKDNKQCKSLYVVLYCIVPSYTFKFRQMWVRDAILV